MLLPDQMEAGNRVSIALCGYWLKRLKEDLYLHLLVKEDFNQRFGLDQKRFLVQFFGASIQFRALQERSRLICALGLLEVNSAIRSTLDFQPQAVRRLRLILRLNASAFGVARFCAPLRCW